MSKPAIFVLSAAALALAVVFGVLIHDGERAKRTMPRPSEMHESTTEPSPSVTSEAVGEPLPALPAPAMPRTPAGEERLDEASLIAALHDLAASDPPRSLTLAREALARFPNSPHSPEFEWNVVKALANMDRYPEAEEEARGMLAKYPGNPLSVDVEHHMLNHPPNPPGTP